MLQKWYIPTVSPTHCLTATRMSFSSSQVCRVSGTSRMWVSSPQLQTSRGLLVHSKAPVSLPALGPAAKKTSKNIQGLLRAQIVICAHFPLAKPSDNGEGTGLPSLQWKVKSHGKRREWIILIQGLVDELGTMIPSSMDILPFLDHLFSLKQFTTHSFTEKLFWWLPVLLSKCTHWTPGTYPTSRLRAKIGVLLKEKFSNGNKPTRISWLIMQNDMGVGRHDGHTRGHLQKELCLWRREGNEHYLRHKSSFSKARYEKSCLTSPEAGYSLAPFIPDLQLSAHHLTC